MALNVIAGVCSFVVKTLQNLTPEQLDQVLD
jgi:hypothetical protein